MRRAVTVQASARVSPAPTNAVVRVVDGIRQKRLGSSDIIVSELGLGTQRWCGADFNSPDEAQFMDRAILNLIDTAGVYLIGFLLAIPEPYVRYPAEHCTDAAAVVIHA